MTEANLITQFWTQPTNYFPFVLSTVMALSGKSSVLLWRGQLWWRLKTIVLWQAAISTLHSGFQQGQRQGRMFRYSNNQPMNTCPELTLLGSGACPKMQSSIQRYVWLFPSLHWYLLCSPRVDGRQRCFSAFILAGSSLRDPGLLKLAI